MSILNGERGKTRLSRGYFWLFHEFGGLMLGSVIRALSGRLRSRWNYVYEILDIVMALVVKFI